ncbi:hypothetical protein NBRC110019_19170 [Neptunitalea chrysea]|uniref:Uncharacterized protein n=2 Tax=Neptunitalea chrysea TaxID=1647581 RepID=A0A9W6B6T8_9FLAO|nr:hypothetical protein NBRC110019_19170 [Neptunitalea chrysea]
MGVFGGELFFYIKYTRSFNKRKNKFLLESLMKGTYAKNILFILNIFIINALVSYTDNHVVNDDDKWVIAGVIIIFLRVSFSVFYELPQSAEKYLTATFPEYKFLNEQS